LVQLSIVEENKFHTTEKTFKNEKSFLWMTSVSKGRVDSTINLNPKIGEFVWFDFLRPANEKPETLFTLH